MPKILIIIPSYNEQDNIVKLIDSLFSVCSHCDILIVDDGFDKTADLVKEAQRQHSNLFLIKRNGKGGRGTAVLDGLKFGLQKNYDFFVEMDADLSHQPNELPSLLDLAKTNAVVIGSRYIKNSRIIGWPWRRRVFSWLANFYANLILRIGIKDYTNGYRVYGRQAVQKIDFNKIKSSGYVVLSEIAHQLFIKGLKFYEVPIIFINRKQGASNFSLREIKEAFLSVFRIKLSKLE